MSDLFEGKGLSTDYSKVILSGSDINIFNQNKKEFWDRKSIFKIVSHHWSQNWMKGFDTYKSIDDLLDNRSGQIESRSPTLEIYQKSSRLEMEF